MRIIVILILATLFTSCQSESKSTQIEMEEPKSLVNGKELFDLNCSFCHNENKNLIGPPFQHIRDDYEFDWIAGFIRNSRSLIYDEKDTIAKFIFYRFGMSMMPSFDTLTDSEIIDILDYVDSFEYDSSRYSHRKLSTIEMHEANIESENKYSRDTSQLLNQIRNFKK